MPFYGALVFRSMLHDIKPDGMTLEPRATGVHVQMFLLLVSWDPCLKDTHWSSAITRVTQFSSRGVVTFHGPRLSSGLSLQGSASGSAKGLISWSQSCNGNSIYGILESGTKFRNPRTRQHMRGVTGAACTGAVEEHCPKLSPKPPTN